ncbi:MAG: AraC family transcriptional regulator [Oscillospiraceae bacterium]
MNTQPFHEAKRHGKDDFMYDTYICTIPLDFASVPLHWHEDMEIIYIKKGEGIISVDLNSKEVTAGDIVVVAPGHLHSIEQKNDKEMQYENILFSLSLLNGLATDWCTAECFLPIRTGEMIVPIFIGKDEPFYKNISRCIDSIDEVCEKQENGYRLCVKAKMYELFYFLYQNRLPQRQTLQKKQSLLKIKEAVIFAEENYAGHITIEQVAKVCNFSPSHFMRFFKGAMGESFVTYLNGFRLSAAATRLRETQDAVIDVAYSCGFENISYFNREFKAKFHKTPREYRKLS